MSVLGVVRVLVLRCDVRAALPRPFDRVRPEDLVRVRTPARLSRHDQEVHPINLDDSGRLISTGPYQYGLANHPGTAIVVGSDYTYEGPTGVRPLFRPTPDD